MKFLDLNKFETEYQYYYDPFLDYSSSDEEDPEEKKLEKDLNDRKKLGFDFKKFFNLNYAKVNIKNRKVLLNIRKGVTLTEKKNSVKRDKNNMLIQQYVNICSKTGNKNTLIKHFNIMVENFFMIFNEEFDEFQNYKNYEVINYLVNNINSYSNFNFLLESTLINFQSIFDIKTKKNQKKLKLQKKFSHEVIYVPKKKRLKNNLKIISIYSENFKYYSYWERLFWMFAIVILDFKKSFVYNRRNYVYKKSVKFFSNKNK